MFESYTGCQTEAERVSDDRDVYDVRISLGNFEAVKSLLLQSKEAAFREGVLEVVAKHIKEEKSKK